MIKRLGVVVPTLGTRVELLQQCIASIRSLEDVHICLVMPEGSPARDRFSVQVESVVGDQGRGLAGAINAGISSLPDSIEFVNWICDDDTIVAEGYRRMLKVLADNQSTVLVYSHCCYIDINGRELFRVRSGRWSEHLLRFGPQLISQPAILFRRDAFENVGRLDEGLGFAFDLDFLLRLRKIGDFQPLSVVAARYRWHHGALSVKRRDESVREASQIRIKHMPGFVRRVSPLWEPLMRWLILSVGMRLQRTLDDPHETSVS